MKEFIHRFSSESDYADYVNSSAYTEPWVSTIGGGVNFLSNSNL